MSDSDWVDDPTFEAESDWVDDPTFEHQPDVGKNILQSISDTIDSYDGAPARKAIGAILEGENPINAFTDQFGEDPSQAPTGYELAQKMGVSEKPIKQTGHYSPKYGFRGEDYEINPAENVGAMIDMVAAPSNLIGLGLGKKALQTGLKASNQAVKTARASKPYKLTEEISRILTGPVEEQLTVAKEYFTPKVAKDYGKLLKTADNVNLKPEHLTDAVKFGDRSFYSFAERSKAEGVLGEPLRDKILQAKQKVSSGVENAIEKIGGGRVLDEIEAGQNLVDSFDKAVKNFSNKIDITHKGVPKLIPGLKLSEKQADILDSKLLGLERYAKGVMNRPFDDTEMSQAKGILQAIDSIRSTDGSYKQIYEKLNRIGQKAFQKNNPYIPNPPDIQRFRKLYGDVSDALIGTLKDNDLGEIANDLVLNNKKLSEFLSDKAALNMIGKDVGPEKIFQSVVKNGDTRKINALKKTIEPEEFQKLKGTYLESLLKADRDGVISFASLRSKLDANRTRIKALFEPNELKEIDELITLGERIGYDKLSFSGTGPSNIFANLRESIGKALANDSILKALKKGSDLRTSPPDIKQNVVKLIPSKKIRSSNEKLKRLAAVSLVAARMLSSQEKNKEIKGKNKWSLDGFEKLHVMKPKYFNKKRVENLFSSTKGKNLLIAASDLTPNSKAMKNLIMKIEKHLKGVK